MSYGIVRVKKIKAGGVTGIQIHDRREKEKSNTNPDIKTEQTPFNYSFGGLADNRTYRSAVKERIESLNLKKAPRKDATVMSQVLFTSDRFFFENLRYIDSQANYDSVFSTVTGKHDSVKDFFQDCYDFACKVYGKENIVDATVHLDEMTPHMHVSFVPATTDGRLSAKDVQSPTKLIKLHDDFFKDVGNKWGLLRGTERDKKEPKLQHMKTSEFKEAMALSNEYFEKATELRIQNEELLKRGNDLEQQIETDTGTLKTINNDIVQVRNEKAVALNELTAVKEVIKANQVILTEVADTAKAVRFWNWCVNKVKEFPVISQIFSMFSRDDNLPIPEPLLKELSRLQTEYGANRFNRHAQELYNNALQAIPSEYRISARSELLELAKSMVGTSYEDGNNKNSVFNAINRFLPAPNRRFSMERER